MLASNIIEPEKNRLNEFKLNNNGTKRDSKEETSEHMDIEEYMDIVMENKSQM